MKKNIHPKYFQKVKVKCSCGNEFYVSSTKPEIKTEVCWKCHPFYTGKRKYVDSRGQVKKFLRRLKKKDEKR